MQRQVRQQRADIESLYDLVSGVDRKVDDLQGEVRDLQTEVRDGFAAINTKMDTQLAEILRRLGDR